MLQKLFNHSSPSDTLKYIEITQDMMDKYIDRGIMYMLDNEGTKSECVVTDEGNGILKIKNIATKPKYQGKGYGKTLIDFIIEKYREKYSVLQVGTGDSLLTIFLQKMWICSFPYCQNFFYR